MNFSNCTVLVLGDVMLDVYIMGRTERISPEAPVPIVEVYRTDYTLGGAGNVAANLASLGCNTLLFGQKGADDHGLRLSGALLAADIRGHLLMDGVTTTKTRVISQGQQIARLDQEANWSGTAEQRSQIAGRIVEELANAQALVISDYAKGMIDSHTCLRVINEARCCGVPVLVDPKRFGGWEAYAGADLIKPNVAELSAEVGEKLQFHETFVPAGRLRNKYGFGSMLVTGGAHGMYWLDSEGQHGHISATSREVFDVSGAGDTVIATVAACLGIGMPLVDACHTAALAAGVVVGKQGTKPIEIAELCCICENRD